MKIKAWTGMLVLAAAVVPGAVLAQLDVRAARVAADPLPATARGPAIDSKKGYHVAEIKDGVYWVTEGTHQFMFVTTGQGVVVVDAPPIFGDRLLAAIREKTDEAITHVVYTHPHPDHIGLAGKLPAGIEVIASDATASELRAAAAGPRAAPFGAFVGGGPVPPPTRTFSERLSLQVGRQRLELTTLDFAAHSIGDTFVYLPRQKVLMAVDAVWPGWVPFEGLGEATDVGGYRRMLARIRDVDFELLVAGHVGRLGTKDDVDTTIEYVDDLERNVIKALGGVDFAAVGQRVGYSNTFLLVEAYFDEVARRASEDTLKKWRGRLGGADVWTYKHALKMLMWVRLH